MHSKRPSCYIIVIKKVKRIGYPEIRILDLPISDQDISPSPTKNQSKKTQKLRPPNGHPHYAVVTGQESGENRLVYGVFLQHANEERWRGVSGVVWSTNPMMKC
jgi:hypothetical protein